jgi:hypothetical protein
MERFVQILDDLDDLCSSLGLARERARGLLLALCIVLLSLAVLIAGVLLALRHPPLAMAAAILMFTTLLYRVVTSPLSRVPAARSDV